MNLKRLLTGIIGFPIVLIFLVLVKTYMMDCTMAIVAIIPMVTRAIVTSDNVKANFLFLKLNIMYFSLIS